MTLRPFGSRARLNLLIILLSAMSTGLATPVQAQASPQASPTTSPYEYQLVNLWESRPPGMLFFDSAGITNDGRVYGTGYRCDDTGCFPSVIVYRSGRQTVLHDGIAYAVNAFGVVGGSLLLDQTTGTEQAAIFTGTHARIIPRLPGEATSQVIGLTDRGTALVVSVNQTFTPQYYLYDARKRVTSIDFGMGTVSSLKINNGNIIAGTISTPGLPDRAFRFNTMSKAMKILDTGYWILSTAIRNLGDRASTGVAMFLAIHSHLVDSNV